MSSIRIIVPACSVLEVKSIFGYALFMDTRGQWELNPNKEWSLAAMPPHAPWGHIRPPHHCIILGARQHRGYQPVPGPHFSLGAAAFLVTAAFLGLSATFALVICHCINCEGSRARPRHAPYTHRLGPGKLHGGWWLWWGWPGGPRVPHSGGCVK
jgi:hypothetical protein